MKITRKALKQSGAGLEQAVRRDMNGAISEALDKSVFQGSGAAGQPTGLLAGAAGWGIVETAVDEAPSYEMIIDQLAAFMASNAGNPGAINSLIRPEVWASLMKYKDSDGRYLEIIPMVARDAGKIVVSSNALAAPLGDPATTNAVLTTSAGGVPPFFVGTWGAVDLIRDPYSDAASGGLRLTALTTVDLTVSRSVQTRILTGIQ